MKNLLFFFLLGLALISCNRDPLIYTIKGTIHDLSLNTNVDDGEISIYKFKPGASATFIEAMNVSNGNFSFEIEREAVDRYELHYESKRYFNKLINIPLSELVVKEPNIYNLETSARSYVTLQIKNENNPNESDELKILKSSGKMDCEGCCPNSYFFFNGIVEEDFTCSNDGNSYFTFHYWINNNEFYKLDSVLTVPFDTVYYQISY